MFNFFNKKSSPLHNLSGFSNQFTKDQKAAILSSLMILAKADGNVNSKETKQIESMFQMLDIEMDDPAFRKFYTAGGKEEIERILNTLSESNKEWFVVAMHAYVRYNTVDELQPVLKNGFEAICIKNSVKILL